MTKPKRRCFLLILALAAFPAGASAQQIDFDQVIDNSGDINSGRFVRGNPNEVVLEVRGLERSFHVNQIKRVVFDDDPRELRSARNAAYAGQLEQAIQDLAKVNVTEINKDIIKEEVEYYRAYATAKLALAGTGDKGGAANQLNAFVQAHPESFHRYEAYELLGDLAVAMNQGEAASKMYDEVGRAPFPDYKMRAAVLKARALQLDEKYAEALDLFDKVVNASYDSAEARQQKMYAQVGKAVCLANTGKPEEGKEIAENIIAKNDPSDHELFAMAYNALGVCHLGTGDEKAALLAYLHTDILFFSDAEAHAEALYHLTSLWEKVNKPSEATRARSLLKDRYGGTVWSKKASF